MYGIFESTNNNFVGFFNNRKKADIYVATENIDYDYDHYYIKELDSLDDEVLTCGNNIRKSYTIIFNYPESSMMNFECKKAFYFAEIDIMGRKEEYTPYFGDIRPITIKSFSSCTIVTVTAEDFYVALDEATEYFRAILNDKDSLLSSEQIKSLVDDYNKIIEECINY